MPLKYVLVKTTNARNFKVSFVSEDSNSDFLKFREAFDKICENDAVLNNIAKDDEKEFSFARFDDMFSCNVEMVQGDAIKNGDVIETSVVSHHNISIVSCGSSTDTSFGEVEVESTEMYPSFDLEESLYGNLEGSFAENREEIIPVSVTDKTKAGKRKRKQNVSVPYPCPLPVFSPSLEKALADGQGVHFYNRFIRECGYSLLSMTEEPTRWDYDNFCRTLSERYSFVNDSNVNGPVPYGYFKKTLSHSIRNGRHYASKLKKAMQFSLGNVADVMVTNEGNNCTSLHIQEMEKALKEKQLDLNHIKRLLDDTAEHRKELINSSKNIQEVQLIYSALKTQEWILYDFDVLTQTTTESREEGFLEALFKLSKLKNVVDFDSDKDKFELLKFVEKEVSKKNMLNCVSLLKVGDPIFENCADVQGPFAVAYLSENGTLTSATILEQKNIVLNLGQMSAFKLYECLLAIYFVFNYEYPKGYFGILSFLQLIMLKQKINSTAPTKLIKFLQKYNKV